MACKGREAENEILALCDEPRCRTRGENTPFFSFWVCSSLRGLYTRGVWVQPQVWQRQVLNPGRGFLNEPEKTKQKNLRVNDLFIVFLEKHS